MRNCVSINLKKDKIIIKLNDGASQSEIIEGLKKKVPDLKNLYKDETTPICVIGKVLKNKEIEEVQQIIRKYINVDLDFESPKTLGLHGIKRAFDKEISTSETKFHRGSVRSGQKLEFEGSIVVLGDVNGGAEIIAGENIVVLGSLRGLAHAGAKGNKQAMISAAQIDCPQIRIANIVKEVEKSQEDIMKIYTYAYVEGEELKLI